MNHENMRKSAEYLLHCIESGKFNRTVDTVNSVTQARNVLTLLDELSAPAWTSETPKEPGFYFYKQADGEDFCGYHDGVIPLRATVVPCTKSRQKPYLRVQSGKFRCAVNTLNGLWCGPITPPEFTT